MAALLSTPAPDNYAIEERVAVQEESAEVSTLPDKPVLSLEEQAEAVLDHYGADWQRGVDDLRIVAMNHVLAALVEKMGIDATQPAHVDSEQDMALPERVTCGSCVGFQPGTTSLGIGTCLATVTGQPPVGNRGDYRAAFRWPRVAVLNIEDHSHEDDPRTRQAIPECEYHENQRWTSCRHRRHQPHLYGRHTFRPSSHSQHRRHDPASRKRIEPMKRKKESPAMPLGYMDALGKLYGKPVEDGPETASQRTQSTGALPMPHLPKRKQP